MSIVLALLVALPGPAQDVGPVAPKTAEGPSVMATVNGQAITSADVRYHTRLLTGQADPVALEASKAVRQLIAEQILLAAECERLGVELTEYQVGDYWKRRFGAPPDYDESASLAGTTVERQKELARRVVLSEIYLLHRVGLQGDHSLRIPPDPVLSRHVTVTPRQLRDFFKAERERLAEPPSVVYEVFPVDDMAAAADVVEALEARRRPESRRIQEAVALDLLDDMFAFAPPLGAFLRDAKVGEVSEPHASTSGVLVLHVIERREGRPADFAEVQEELRNRIRSSLLGEARDELVASLAQGAVYWPADLFSASVASSQ